MSRIEEGEMPVCDGAALETGNVGAFVAGSPYMTMGHEVIVVADDHDRHS